jgi:hypothetical protein
MEKSNNIVLSDAQFNKLLETITRVAATSNTEVEGGSTEPTRTEEPANKWARPGAVSPRPAKGDYTRTIISNRLTKDDLKELRKSSLRKKK